MKVGASKMNNLRQAQFLKSGIQRLIQRELEEGLNPWWFISFHYNDGKTNENQVIKDIADLKNKLYREIYRSRDRCVAGLGPFPYPKMLVMSEVSHLGTGQFHSHLILEALPARLNTQEMIETLFKKNLPSKVKSLSRWKSVHVQRIHQDVSDLRKLVSYLAKQVDL